MAGVKGRSGGAREGSGRKPAPKVMAENIDEDFEDPLEFMRAMMKDKSLPADVRLRAASELAKHQAGGKAKPIGKKQEQAAAAQDAATGKFAPGQPPKLKLVNG